MIRTVARNTARRQLVRPLRAPGARFASTAPVDKPRGWKSMTARLAIAGGLVYYYNTSPVFAEAPEVAIAKLDEMLQKPLTIEAIVEEKHKREAEAAAKAKQLATTAQEMAADAKEAVIAAEEQVAEKAADVMEPADPQGAFNPETGEINWDCPCLGGMADGPCGEDFKAAFSCFVYSTEEPKGMECIEKFKGMQDCFRKYPEIYGAELEDDETPTD